MKVFERLNTPYPLVLNKWKLTLSISIFIAFFLSFFQPFGLQFLDVEHKTLILLGYGGVTLTILVFNLYGIPRLIPNVFEEDRWTVLKQVLWLTWIVLGISTANYLYSTVFSVVGWSGLLGFFVFVGFTLPIAVLPIIILTVVTQNVYLQRNLQLSSELNHSLQKNKDSQKKLTLRSGSHELNFRPQEIVLLESDGNYVNIYSQEDNGLKKQQVRNTLKGIEADLDTESFFKCHRAFIVNLDYIENVKGNSQGLTFTISNFDRPVPVSRNNIKPFRELLIQRDTSA